MSTRFRDENSEEFFHAVLSLENIQECNDFFEDLCTVKELQSIIQRYHVARMLDDGKLYTDIVKETGASTATISRVNRSLAYGCDGYKTVLKKRREKDENR